MSSVLARVLQKKGRSRVTMRRALIEQKKLKKMKFISWSRREARAKDRIEKKKIDKFMKWCIQEGIELHPNVSVEQESGGSCSGLGVVAKDDITKGECVALIPRSALLSCATSSIADKVLEDKELMKACSSSWPPLLLALAAEYACEGQSKWHPYLSLVPTDTRSLPMEWMESVRQSLLEGTAVDSWVNNDITRIEEDYESLIKPFRDKYPQLFKVSLPNCDVYKKLVAFVMSYSFTDEGAGLLGSTMMVPFVDLLNHSSDHHVELSFHPKCLRLMAVRNIAKGEEIMNTYGQLSSAALLHKYGFTEKGNPHDEAVIPCDLVKEVYLAHFSTSRRWDVLLRKGLLESEYHVDIEGQPDQDLLMLTRLLCSTDKPRKCLQPVSLQDCSTEELVFLTRVAKSCLAVYPEEVNSPAPLSSSTEESHCWQVVLGQQTALKNLITRSC